MNYGNLKQTSISDIVRAFLCCTSIFLHAVLPNFLAGTETFLLTYMFTPAVQQLTYMFTPAVQQLTNPVLNYKYFIVGTGTKT
jgi:hypothetical protein